jgi:hypothetical protein
VTVAAAGRMSLHCTIPQRGMSNSMHELTRKGVWQLAYGSKKENDSRIAVAERWHDVFTVAAPAALPCGFCTAVSSGGRDCSSGVRRWSRPLLKGVQARTLPPLAESVGAGTDVGCGLTERTSGEDGWGKKVAPTCGPGPSAAVRGKEGRGNSS